MLLNERRVVEARGPAQPAARSAAREQPLKEMDGLYWQIVLENRNFCKIIKQTSISEVVQNNLVKLT